jgi:chemotaxis protein methyltransferase CheR
MTLSDAQFRSLSARIAELVGIHIATEKRWLLSARVKERLETTGDQDEARYVARVLAKDGTEELGNLVEAIRVGETQFYRHAGQLRAIERVALPEIVARRQSDGTRKVRVWSAGCATGEEPYTLAMLLDSFLTRNMGFEILATDLSSTALDAAREGR